jgi:hypothetical protein
MFYHTKIEENSELSLLASSPFYRKVFCKDHGFVYQYRCINPHCNGFTCGKMECIDHHFHNNQLKIEKFNANDLIHKILRMEELSKLPKLLTPRLN